MYGNMKLLSYKLSEVLHFLSGPGYRLHKTSDEPNSFLCRRDDEHTELLAKLVIHSDHLEVVFESEEGKKELGGSLKRYEAQPKRS